MSLLTCWSLRAPNMDTQLPHWTPSIALRLLQKTCGLFDKSGTGVVVDDHTSATTVKAGAGQLTADAVDLLSALDMGLDLLEPGAELLGTGSESLPDLTPGSNPTSPNQLGNSFCETYTDLSNFLFGDTTRVAAMEEEEQFVFPDSTVDTTALALEATLEVEQPPTEMEIDGGEMGLEPVVVLPSQTEKRTHSKAFCDVASPNPDHNDYILKNKRPCLASTSAKMSGSPTRVEKYVERRRKNNIASKRSRETRKQKFVDMEKRADQLEKDNEVLRIRAEQLEKLAKKMKDLLVQRLAAGAQN